MELVCPIITLFFENARTHFRFIMLIAKIKNRQKYIKVWS